MKKKFEFPQIEVINIINDDVITCSTPQQGLIPEDSLSDIKDVIESI